MILEHGKVSKETKGTPIPQRFETNQCNSSGNQYKKNAAGECVLA